MYVHLREGKRGLRVWREAHICRHCNVVNLRFMITFACITGMFLFVCKPSGINMNNKHVFIFHFMNELDHGKKLPVKLDNPLTPFPKPQHRHGFIPCVVAYRRIIDDAVSKVTQNNLMKTTKETSLGCTKDVFSTHALWRHDA